MLDTSDPKLRDQLTEITILVVTRIGLLFLIAYLCLFIITPFLGVLLWAVILAVTLYPVYRWLTARFGGRGSFASTLIVLTGLGITLIPSSLLAAASLDGLRALEAGLADGSIVLPPPPEGVATLPFVGTELSSLWWLAATNLQGALAELKPQTAAVGGFLLKSSAGAGLAVLQFAVSVIIAGLLFAPGPKLFDALNRFAERVLSARASHFVSLSHVTVKNVAQGVIGIALLQTILASFGYLAADFPFGAVFTLLVLLLSILNLGPTTPVLISIIWGWTFMETVPALLFTLYMLPVGLLDNVMRPIIVARGLPVPIAVMFIGVMGGALTGGLLGLFIGPVVLAVGHQLFSAWIAGGSTAAEEQSG